MKLIKLTDEQYVIVDDSEIKQGDYLYSFSNNKIVVANKLTDLYVHSKKITYSTQPLEKITKEVLEDSFKRYDYIPLQEVKELIGEVNVEKKAINSWEGCDGCDANDELFFINGYQKGYNQALEDNKEKKYTEEDMLLFAAEIIGKLKLGIIKEVEDVKTIIQSLQHKTEWEVKFVDGKLKLK